MLECKGIKKKGSIIMKKYVKIIAAVLAVCALSLCLFSCNGGGLSKAASYDASATGEGTEVKISAVLREIDSKEVSDFVPSDEQSDFVLIKVKDYGEIVIVLRRDVAPDTVKNFKSLVADGFYNGVVFHRVMEGFMIQGGGFVPEGTSLKQKEAANIKGEFTANGFKNNLTHIRGVISMARVGGLNDSASSQFFIMHATAPTLNDQYASFGYVLAGMDVVDAIATCEVDDPSSQSPQPVENVVIESMSFVQPK
jgi:peptidyl-prolyl cis-trans isomerase B (cyclophilin B)